MLYNSLSAFEAADIAWRWPHFSAAELSCKCGGKHCEGEYFHDEDFLDGLERLRALCGRPLSINSGHRCEGHNKAVGGAEHSRHLEVAADISLRGHDRKVIRPAAIKAGFHGIGLGKTFIHVDRRPQLTVWYYPGSPKLWN